MRTYGDLYLDAGTSPSSAPLIGSGVLSWSSKSDTWADVTYTVTRTPDGRWECDCPGFRYQARADGLCKHVDRWRAYWETDPLAAAAEAVLSWLQ